MSSLSVRFSLYFYIGIVNIVNSVNIAKAIGGQMSQLTFLTLKKVSSVSQSRRSQYSIQTKRSTMTNMKEALEKCTVQDSLGGRGRKTWLIVTLDKNLNLKEILGAQWCAHQHQAQCCDGAAHPLHPQGRLSAAGHHYQRQLDDPQECLHCQPPAQDHHWRAQGLKK